MIPPSGHCHCDILTCISLVFSYNFLPVSQAYVYSVPCMNHITFKEQFSSLLDCHEHSPDAKSLSLILAFTTAQCPMVTIKHCLLCSITILEPLVGSHFILNQYTMNFLYFYFVYFLHIGFYKIF